MVDRVRDGEGWDAWDDVDLQRWVSDGRPEPSAQERTARTARIAHEHARLDPGAAGPPPALRRSKVRAGQKATLLLLASVVGGVAWLSVQPGEPLGRPAVAPDGEGGYAFLNERPDGRPVTFDPCKEIPYVVRPDGSPPSGAAMIATALGEVSQATGLVFVDKGLTDEAPTSKRHLDSRWSLRDRTDPVLIAWATEQEWPALAGTVVGEAGPVAESVGRSVPRYTSGQVVLDAADLAHAPGDAAGAEQVRLVLLHELGHLVGLDHVADPSQLMYEETGPGLTGFGTGDLRGLHALGSGDCV